MLGVGHPYAAAFRWLEFEDLVRSTPGGTEYLYEPLTGQTQARPRIRAFRERMAISTHDLWTLIDEPTREPELRAAGLRMLRADELQDARARLQRLLASPHTILQLEAVRTVSEARLPDTGELLRQVAANGETSLQVRASAILGLAHDVRSDANRKLILRLAQQSNPDWETLRIESLRSLRGLAAEFPEVAKTVQQMLRNHRGVSAAPKNSPGSKNSRSKHNELVAQLQFTLSGTPLSKRLNRQGERNRPRELSQWWNAVKKGGSPSSGRRVFFHPRSAGCYRCHRVDGRGGRIASNLSGVARYMSRRRLLEALLFPSRRIPADYVQWTVLDKFGKSYSGVIVGETEGGLDLGTSDGQIVRLCKSRIQRRLPQRKSLMPENLIETLTVEEVRNLLAYLQTLK